MGIFSSLIGRVFGRPKPGEGYGPMAPINEILNNNVTKPFDYGVVWIPGAAQDNALFNASEAEAALAQTQQEHNDALNKFLNATQYKPSVRARMGRETEKNLVKWNPNKDTKPRRPLTPSSSVISDIKILPNNNIGVRFNKKGPKGGGEYYEYRGGSTVQEAAQEVLNLLRGGSLGRNLNTRIPGTWGAAHNIPR